jgi:2-polyprenyl-3-methyl-5-hydroxy-6-metoxy-1,4-benzoquinol methylase
MDVAAGPSAEFLREQIAPYEWYQSIDLGQGVITPGETGDASQNKLAMMKLPEDLTGQSVLDIGCNEGFFSFEAEKRGASRIVAIDKGKAAQEKFALVHRLLASSVEFHDVDLTEIKPAQWGKFDLVFFLAVLHHIRHPFWILDHIYKLTGGVAVMEFVEAVPDDGSDLSAFVRRMSKRGHLHMMPTRTMTLELLDQAGFKTVEILGAHRAKGAGEHRRMPGFSQQRVLLKAHR